VKKDEKIAYKPFILLNRIESMQACSLVKVLFILVYSNLWPSTAESLVYTAGFLLLEGSEL
jgi:hypothetical protein